MKKEFMNYLAAGPDLLEDLIRSIPRERINRRFGTSVWTVHEHLDHLAETQVMLVERLELLINDPSPVIIPFVPEEDGAAQSRDLQPVERLLKSFRRDRARQLEIIDAAPEALWERPVVHPEYEHYSLVFLVRHILFHDGLHFYRIEDLGFLSPEHIRPM